MVRMDSLCWEVERDPLFERYQAQVSMSFSAFAKTAFPGTEQQVQWSICECVCLFRKENHPDLTWTYTLWTLCVTTGKHIGQHECYINEMEMKYTSPYHRWRTKTCIKRSLQQFGEIKAYLWTHSDSAIRIMKAKELINQISPSPQWGTEWWIFPAHPSQACLSLAAAENRIIRTGQKEGYSSSSYKGKIR